MADRLLTVTNLKTHFFESEGVSATPSETSPSGCAGEARARSART